MKRSGKCKKGQTAQGRRHEQGLVTVVILILILLASIYVAANMRVLASLRREIDLIDQRQSVSEPCDPDPSP